MTRREFDERIERLETRALPPPPDSGPVIVTGRIGESAAATRRRLGLADSCIVVRIIDTRAQDARSSRVQPRASDPGHVTRRTRRGAR